MPAEDTHSGPASTQRSRWKEIYELNKDVIGDNPDVIHPGKKLKLPE